jgi:hypothetical protein
MKSRSRLSLLLVGGVVCAIQASVAQADGVLYFSRDGDIQTSGLYTVSTETGESIRIGNSGVTGATVGLAEGPSPEVLYGSKWAGLLEIQADGGGWNSRGGVGNEGLAYDLENDVLYGALNGRFRTIDPATGNVLVTLTAPGVDIEGLAYGGGYVYGLARGRTGLYRYDVGSGQWAVVGSTGIMWDLPGLAYDSTMHTLYGKGRQGMDLYAINPDNASTRVIGSTGIAQGGGLAFVVPEPSTVALFAIGGLAALRRKKR